MRDFFLLYIFLILLSSCSSKKAGQTDRENRDSAKIAFNTRGINRSVPPPTYRNHPQGSVGMGAPDQIGTAAITDLNQDKLFKNLTPENRNISVSDWNTGSMTAKKFINHAYQSGLTEIELAKTARKESDNEKLKDYASMMIKDHANANSLLKKLAKQKGINLSEDSLKKVITTYNDNSYINWMLQDHKVKIALYEKASASSDQEIISFAKQQLPLLKRHLAELVLIQEQTKK